MPKKIGENMFKIGDIISVSKKGICRLENIAKDVFEGCDKTKTYYVLRPLSQINNMVVYFPTDTKLAMREVVSKSKATQALSDLKAEKRMEGLLGLDRTNVVSKLLMNGEFEDWVNLLCTLCFMKKTLSKKEFGALEQKQLVSVMELLASEISVATKQDEAEIKQIIKEKLEI